MYNLRSRKATLISCLAIFLGLILLYHRSTYKLDSVLKQLLGDYGNIQKEDLNAVPKYAARPGNYVKSKTVKKTYSTLKNEPEVDNTIPKAVNKSLSTNASLHTNPTHQSFSQLEYERLKALFSRWPPHKPKALIYFLVKHDQTQLLIHN